MKSNTKYVKSPMNYTGGKYKLLKQILPLFPQKIDRFVDLFCGGCNVSVNVPYAGKVIANDYDENVISIYRKFQLMPIDDILSYIDDRVNEYSLTKENSNGYIAFRDMYNTSVEKNPLDLYVLICYSFNNQIRFNSRGEFNMPFGKNRSSFNTSMRSNLINFHEAIKDIVFTCKSFDDLKLWKMTSGDFVYCDPPYLITCATYNERGRWDELCERKLIELLDNLNDNGVRFALSNALSNKGATNDILSEWCGKYNVYHLSNSYSNCSYHSSDRGSNTTDEVLITNY